MKKVNRYLDHAVLKPELSRQEAIEAIQLGIDYEVKSVCVRPCDIELAVEMCKGTNTIVSCVLAFPHGHSTTETKLQETKQYCAFGVSEIDMVANYGFIKSALWDEVYKDIVAVVEEAHKNNVIVKVIVESGVLTLEEVEKVTKICIKANADFIKTSTGFNGGGATVDVLEVMVANCEDKIKVKASGGVRNFETAKKYVEMGCSRLGINYSSCVAICDGGESADKGGY